MAATIGSDPEKYLIRTGCETVADAMILDACFSACAENVCDNLEEDIREELAEKGLYLTGRFSPGYGDLPLGLQREILDVLNAGGRIGLTLSESGLMIPRKSVTAVLGVSETPRRGKRAGCEACAMSGNCSYQKEGVTCG